MSDQNPYGPPYPQGPPQQPYGGYPQQPDPGPQYGQQPPYGQPQQENPPYGQPGFEPQYGQGQPPYGQPGFEPQYGQGQPPYGQQPLGGSAPPYSGAPYGPPVPGQQPPFGFPPAPPRKSRVGRTIGIVLGVVGLVVVLCCGVAVWLGHDFINEINPTLTTPNRVAGLTRSDEPNLQQLSDQVSQDLKSSVDFDDTIAAFYEDPTSSEKLVMLAGGTTVSFNPGGDLSDAFEGMRSSGANFSDIKDVDPGSLGGTMRCGATTIESIPVTACGWADHGCLVLGMFFSRDVTESAVLFRQIRSEIQHR